LNYCCCFSCMCTWRPEAHWRWRSRGACGNLLEWSVGHCVWWLLGSRGCQCRLQTARIL